MIYVNIWIAISVSVYACIDEWQIQGKGEGIKEGGRHSNSMGGGLCPRPPSAYYLGLDSPLQFKEEMYYL